MTGAPVAADSALWPGLQSAREPRRNWSTLGLSLRDHVGDQGERGHGGRAAATMTGTTEFRQLDLADLGHCLVQRAPARLDRLQRRLTAIGSPVIATAAHPGFAAANLLGHLETERPFASRLSMIFLGPFAQSDEGGARPTLFAATADVPGNGYAGPGGFLESRGAPKLVGRSKAAQDPELARRLWALSEELTGVRFPLTVER